jgi:CubicO group peptidase (beta-lactamase class C family)
LFGIYAGPPTHLPTPPPTTPTPLSRLITSLQKAIEATAFYNNVSYSFAAVSDKFTAAAAAGFNDHKTGSQVTIESLYPVGSVTKPYTAVAAMQFVDQGLLDLDSPVHRLLDPWLQTQSPPTTLLQLWNNDSTIENVTSRHLLGMQAGFSDYNDAVLKNWTINNPGGNISPMDFIRQLNKAFMFKPGQGAAYSGTH